MAAPFTLTLASEPPDGTVTRETPFFSTVAGDRVQVRLRKARTDTASTVLLATLFADRAAWATVTDETAELGVGLWAEPARALSA